MTTPHDNPCRVSVTLFAQAMEEKLRENDHKGGWGCMDLFELVDLLKEEIEELEVEILLNAEVEDIVKECADIGNFAMMIADRSAKWTNQRGRITNAGDR